MEHRIVDFQGAVKAAARMRRCADAGAKFNAGGAKDVRAAGPRLFSRVRCVSVAGTSIAVQAACGIGFMVSNVED